MNDHAIVIADTGGIIRFWNAGAQSAFGHASADVLGASLDVIVPDEYRRDHWTGFHRAMGAGMAAAEGRATAFPVRRADGSIAPTSGRLTLLRAPGGSVIGAMVVFAGSIIPSAEASS